MEEKYNKEAYEAGMKLVAATLKGEAEVSLDKEGAKNVMNYFYAIYSGMDKFMKGEIKPCCQNGHKSEKQAPEDEETEKTQIAEPSDEQKEKPAQEKSDFIDEELLQQIREDVLENEEITKEQTEQPQSAPEAKEETGAAQQSEEVEKKKRYGKFVIKQSEAGFSFTLKAANGEVIAASEGYKTKEGCLKGIESIKRSAEGKIEDQTEEGFAELANPKFELYKDVKGEFRFRLKAVNGELIAASEGYTRKESCLNGIESIRRNVLMSETIEL